MGSLDARSRTVDLTVRNMPNRRSSTIAGTRVAHRREWEHERKAVGGRWFEAVALVEAGRALVDGVHERGAHPDLLGRRDEAAESVTQQVAAEFTAW